MIGLLGAVRGHWQPTVVLCKKQFVVLQARPPVVLSHPLESCLLFRAVSFDRSFVTSVSCACFIDRVLNLLAFLLREAHASSQKDAGQMLVFDDTRLSLSLTASWVLFFQFIGAGFICYKSLALFLAWSPDLMGKANSGASRVSLFLQSVSLSKKDKTTGEKTVGEKETVILWHTCMVASGKGAALCCPSLVSLCVGHVCRSHKMIPYLLA